MLFYHLHDETFIVECELYSMSGTTELSVGTFSYFEGAECDRLM